MQFVKDWIFWVQSCLDFFPSVYLGSLFPDNLRRCSAESLQGDGPRSGEGTNYTWENRAAQVGPMEGTAEESYLMWWGQGLHVLEPDAQPTLGQEKASKSYCLLFSGSDQTTGWLAAQRESAVGLQTWGSSCSLQDVYRKPFRFISRGEHRISALAARSKFICLLSCLVSVLVFQK